jgi:hypothetical protein
MLNVNKDIEMWWAVLRQELVYSAKLSIKTF